VRGQRKTDRLRKRYVTWTPTDASELRSVMREALGWGLIALQFAARLDRPGDGTYWNPAEIDPLDAHP
jgi:hypothetical protein